MELKPSTWSTLNDDEEVKLENVQLNDVSDIPGVGYTLKKPWDENDSNEKALEYEVRMETRAEYQLSRTTKWLENVLL